MKKSNRHFKQWMLPILLTAMVPLMMGCPEIVDYLTYDMGFELGFANDTKYEEGFDDSFEVDEDHEAIRYTGHLMPYLEDDSYLAGLYDGEWEAYNDGYFDAYLEAFDTGFADGYEAAYASDWVIFLLNDVHVEWEDGAYRDGYNDGYSEGRILGADDYRTGLPSDWEDAWLFYIEGNDIFIELVEMGTGEYGPVYLYEWGMVPVDLNVAKANLPQRNSIKGISEGKRRTVRMAHSKSVNQR